MAHGIAEKMKAAAIERFGGLDQLKVFDLPKPEPGPDEVLIRVRAAGVGIWDSLQRTGELAPDAPEFPMILGAECSGDVERIGANVTTLHDGQAVYSYFRGEQGAYAEYVAVKATMVAPKPASLSYTEAAAVPVDAITAHQALVDELKIKAGEWCFIAGGAGGVGSLAVQIAISLGAQVIVSARAENFAVLESFGVMRGNLIDYTQADLGQAVRDITGGHGADAALDAVGGESSKQTIQVVRDGGRLAELTTQELPETRGIKIFHVQSRPSAKRLAILGEMFDARVLKIHVGRVLTLVQAREAQEAVEEHRGMGKIVLKID
ncbi:MAG: NADP-dependent oxidoreductase [Candidatus Eremiobacteraeota bacterium]|nr:NADP-dependent oxidoreductase [Candidatus Eremiobacteraeota bacterium]